jgi:hypothetical protein
VLAEVQFTVPNYALRGFRVDDRREVRIEYAAVFVVPTVYLQEMGAEILDDRLVIVGAVAEGGDADEKDENQKLITYDYGQITYYF